MTKFRGTAVIGIALVATSFGAGWLSKTWAQDQAPSTYSFITVFDHKKVDASFTKAIPAGGSMILFRRNTHDGIYRVNTQSRESVAAACPAEGCYHEGFTAVVYVVSGAATLEVGDAPGASKPSGPDTFGGEPLMPHTSHRISQGDVIVVPPNRRHWYKDVEKPFRYLEVGTP